MSLHESLGKPSYLQHLSTHSSLHVEVVLSFLYPSVFTVSTLSCATALHFCGERTSSRWLECPSSFLHQPLRLSASSLHFKEALTALLISTFWLFSKTWKTPRCPYADWPLSSSCILSLFIWFRSDLCWQVIIFFYYYWKSAQPERYKHIEVWNMQLF